ncbi:hypothetical protein SAXI111661_04805 [Saccharomonospora xinjiangensis]|nr:hypothetical protein EYD13_02985 [Saccharomonospora xinjiangensis]
MGSAAPDGQDGGSSPVGRVAGRRSPATSVLRRSAARLAVAGLFLTVASCATETSGDTAENPETRLSGKVLTPAKQPPGNIPEVRFLTPEAKTPGSLVYADWITAETAMRKAPDDVGGAPEVRVPGNGRITLEIDTNVAPGYAEVITYTNRGSNGIPRGELERLTCEPAPRAGRCVLNVHSDRSTAEFTAHHPAAVLVFYASWVAPSADRVDGEVRLPPEVSASWAFLVGP